MASPYFFFLSLSLPLSLPFPFFLSFPLAGILASPGAPQPWSCLRAAQARLRLQGHHQAAQVTISSSRCRRAESARARDVAPPLPRPRGPVQWPGAGGGQMRCHCSYKGQCYHMMSRNLSSQHLLRDDPFRTALQILIKKPFISPNSTHLQIPLLTDHLIEKFRHFYSFETRFLTSGFHPYTAKT